MKRRDFIGTVGTLTVAGIPIGSTAANLQPLPISLQKTVLPKRLLGKTGVEVSAMSLGGVIGMQLEPSNELDPADIANVALDLGITYFDTAPSYNNGQSETNFGRVLAHRRNEVFLACKTGDRTYDGTMRSVEQSLKRLQTDRFDLLQIHGIGENEDLEAWGKETGVYKALCKLKETKVTRFIGATSHESAEKLRQAIEMYELDTILTTLNPVSRRRPYRESLLPVANIKKMGVIAMKVFGGGNGCFVEGNPMQTKLRSYHDDTPNQVDAESLIRYTLSLPITTAVMGVSSVVQLKKNIEIVRKMTPMPIIERKALEARMG
ncbi:MAG: aldo/keto reductase [Candidatus Omnitrophica bacterium]|nr:aldo/keto reductase [Candidatus Omnitrophota bacterium]